MNIQKIANLPSTIAIIWTLTMLNLTISAEDKSFTHSVTNLNAFQVDASNQYDPGSKTIDGVSSALQEGIDAARKALKNKRCSALFGDMRNEGFESAIDLLNTYANNNLTREGRSDTRGAKFENAGVGAMTSHAAGSFKNSFGLAQSASVITINRNGFYFSGRIDDGRDVTSVKGGGFERLDMSSIRGAVLIHELLHAMGRIPQDVPALLQDGGKQSMANAELVRKNCFDR